MDTNTLLLGIVILFVVLILIALLRQYNVSAVLKLQNFLELIFRGSKKPRTTADIKVKNTKVDKDAALRAEADRASVELSGGKVGGSLNIDAGGEQKKTK